MLDTNGLVVRRDITSVHFRLSGRLFISFLSHLVPLSVLEMSILKTPEFLISVEEDDECSDDDCDDESYSFDRFFSIS